MFKVGDYVVYRKDVCKIVGLEKDPSNGKEYYKLTPIDDESLMMSVPVEIGIEYLREVVTLDEALKLIDKIKSIEVITTDEKNYENEYKRLFEEGTLESLVAVIKTAYLRNDIRLQNKKKISAKDDTYFKKAERRLYNELSVVLNKTFDETKEYVIEAVESSSE